MRYDLDGDGAVTEDEIWRAMRYDLEGRMGPSRHHPPAKSPIAAAETLEKQIESHVRSIMALIRQRRQSGIFGSGQIVSARYASRSRQYGQPARVRQAPTLDTDLKERSRWRTIWAPAKRCSARSMPT